MIQGVKIGGILMQDNRHQYSKNTYSGKLMIQRIFLKLVLNPWRAHQVVSKPKLSSV
jgi:hypothetical protein